MSDGATTAAGSFARWVDAADRIRATTRRLEVTFDIVQKSARHKAGYALRFPRIVHVRDEPPTEIDTLQRVRELAGEG